MVDDVASRMYLYVQADSQEAILTCLERAESSAILAARAWPACVDSMPTSLAFLAAVLALMAFRLPSSV